MTKKTSVKDITTYGGRLIRGEKVLDGEYYGFRSTWNSDEQADEFLDAIGCQHSGRDFVDGILTVWFN